jgi:hypothetical protein
LHHPFYLKPRQLPGVREPGPPGCPGLPAAEKCSRDRAKHDLPSKPSGLEINGPEAWELGKVLAPVTKENHASKFDQKRNRREQGQFSSCL